MTYGRVAQLVERLRNRQEVAGSSPRPAHRLWPRSSASERPDDNREVGRGVARAAKKGGGLESPRGHRFTPDRKVGFRVQNIGRPDCPYLWRAVLNLRFFSIRLHHWRASDDDRALHDHPWWFTTLVLKGSYTDISAGPNYDSRFDHPDIDGTYPSRALPGVITTDRLRPGSIRHRPALHTHTVQVDPGGCWSLLVTGPHARDWGFWVDGQWKRMRRYFKEVGHHPCD